jgi:hypothetical protein
MGPARLAALALSLVPAAVRLQDDLPPTSQQNMVLPVHIAPAVGHPLAAANNSSKVMWCLVWGWC